MPIQTPSPRLILGELCALDVGATVTLHWNADVEVTIEFLELIVEDGLCTHVVVGFAAGNLQLPVETPITIVSPAPKRAVPVEASGPSSSSNINMSGTLGRPDRRGIVGGIVGPPGPQGPPGPAGPVGAPGFNGLDGKDAPVKQTGANETVIDVGMQSAAYGGNADLSLDIVKVDPERIARLTQDFIGRGRNIGRS